MKITARFSHKDKLYFYDNGGLRIKNVRRPIMYRGFLVELRDNVVFAPFRYEWKITAITESAKNRMRFFNYKITCNDPTSHRTSVGDHSALYWAKDKIDSIYKFRAIAR